MCCMHKPIINLPKSLNQFRIFSLCCCASYESNHHFLADNNPCLIEIVPNDPLLESQNQIGMYLQKNSPFTQMFK